MNFIEVNQQSCNQDGICSAACPATLINFTKGEYPTPIAAAEALAYLGYEKRALRAIMRNLKHSSPMVRLHAANVLDALGSKAKPAAKKLRSMVIYMEKLKSKSPEENYLLSALSHTVSRL